MRQLLAHTKLHLKCNEVRLFRVLDHVELSVKKLIRLVRFRKDITPYLPSHLYPGSVNKLFLTSVINTVDPTFFVDLLQKLTIVNLRDSDDGMMTVQFSLSPAILSEFIRKHKTRTTIDTIVSSRTVAETSTRLFPLKRSFMEYE